MAERKRVQVSLDTIKKIEDEYGKKSETGKRSRVQVSTDALQKIQKTYGIADDTLKSDETLKSEKLNTTLHELSSWQKRGTQALQQEIKALKDTKYTKADTLKESYVKLGEYAREVTKYRDELEQNRSLLGDSTTNDYVKSLNDYLGITKDVMRQLESKMHVMSLFDSETEYERAQKDAGYSVMSRRDRQSRAKQLEEDADKIDVGQMKPEDAAYYKTVADETYESAAKAALEAYEKGGGDSLSAALTFGEAVNKQEDSHLFAEEMRREAARIRALDARWRTNEYDSMTDEELNARLAAVDRMRPPDLQQNLFDMRTQAARGNERGQTEGYFQQEPLAREAQDLSYLHDPLNHLKEMGLVQKSPQQKALDAQAMQKRVDEQTAALRDMTDREIEEEQKALNAYMKKRQAQKILSQFSEDKVKGLKREVSIDRKFGGGEKSGNLPDITNELWAKSLLISEEDAALLREYLDEETKREEAEAQDRIIRELATSNFFAGAGMTLLSVPANLIGGVFATAATAGQAIDNALTGKDEQLDTNSDAFLLTNFAQSVRGGITDAANDVDKSGFLGFLYGTGTSMLDSLGTVALEAAAPGIGGAVGLGMMGASASASTIKDSIERGATLNQALVNGLLQGAVEVVTEKVSLENLLKPKGMTSAVARVLQQAGVEASEETAAGIADLIIEGVVMRDKSEYNKEIEAYLASGTMTRREAEAAATRDMVGQVMIDTLGGALSGGVMGGGATLWQQATHQDDFAYYVEEEAKKLKQEGFSGDIDAEATFRAIARMTEENAKRNEAKREKKADKQAAREARKSGQDAQETSYIKEDVEREADVTAQRTAAENRLKATAKGGASPLSFVSTGNNVKIKTADGKTVNEQEVKYESETQRKLFERASRFNPAQANAFLSQYDGSMSVEEYDSAYNAFVRAERLYDSFDDVLKKGGEVYQNLAKRIGESTAKLAYTVAFNADQNITIRQADRARVDREGGVVRNYSIKPTAAQKIQIDTLEAIGQTWGVAIEVVDDIGMNANGVYNTATKRVTIGLNTLDRAILRTASHEMYHYIEQNAPNEAKDLREYVTGKLKQNANYNYEAKKKWLLQNGYNEGNVDSEITADAMFDVLNEETIEQLAKENPSVFKRILAHFEHLIMTIENAIDRIASKRANAGAEIRALRGEEKTLKTIRKKFVDAMEKIKLERGENAQYNNNEGKKSATVKRSIMDNGQEVNEYDRADRAGEEEGRRVSSGSRTASGGETRLDQRRGTSRGETREDADRKLVSERNLRTGENGGIRSGYRASAYGYERTDEFRRIQEESRRLSAGRQQRFHEGSETFDGGLRETYSRVLRGQLLRFRDSHYDQLRILEREDSKTHNKFRIYEKVDGALFHDVFEIVQRFLKMGEMVDVHGVETTEDEIGYADCENYLSEDGLSGFSITPKGDLISVFNASGKSGFLRAISDIIKEKVKTLDCYAIHDEDVRQGRGTNLRVLYEENFGLKTASTMAYNMEFDHDGIAERYDNPPVCFLVRSDTAVEERQFSADQYDQAINYRDSYVSTTIKRSIMDNGQEVNEYDRADRAGEEEGRRVSSGSRTASGGETRLDQRRGASRGETREDADRKLVLERNLRTGENGGVSSGLRGPNNGYERTDEFRRIQEENRRLSARRQKQFHEGSETFAGRLREDYSRVFRRELSRFRDSHYDQLRILEREDSKTRNKFRFYEKVDGALFHDIFEIVQRVLEMGEMVDVHGIETTEDGIGYADCENYLSEDGLSGFSITPKGDLISVFNASGKKGFLRAISDIIKEKVKTLDCYAIHDEEVRNGRGTNLRQMYERYFGLKTASTMAYNMEYDHDGIAERYDNPPVCFLVRSDTAVEERQFSADQYDQAISYRDSYVSTTIKRSTMDNGQEVNEYDRADRAGEEEGRRVSSGSRTASGGETRLDQRRGASRGSTREGSNRELVPGRLRTGENGGVHSERRTSAYGFEKTDEFRRIQEESRRLSAESQQRFHEGSETFDGGLRETYSRVLRGQLLRFRDSHYDQLRILEREDSKTHNKFRIYEKVDGALFHDIFEMVQRVLKMGEMVDVHGVETTEDGIGYADCENYLSDDGLSGFSITPKGDLISVFNASGKSGFLRAISDIIKEKVKTLDCYAIHDDKVREGDGTNLRVLYEENFGLKTASTMDYNMEFDHDGIAERYDNPPVCFLVRSETAVEERQFSADQYDQAISYRDSYVDADAEAAESPDTVIKPSTMDKEERNLLQENEQLKKAIAALKREFKLTNGMKVSDEAVKSFAEELILENHSSMNADELAPRLTKVFDYIASDPEKNGEAALSAAREIARNLLGTSGVYREEYADAREYLKFKRISLPEGMDKAQYDAIRKKLFGRLTVGVNKGIPYDVFVQEFIEKFPEFREQIFGENGLSVLQNFANVVEQVYEKVSAAGTDLETEAMYLAMRIFDAYVDLPAQRTFADKKQAEVNAAKREYRLRMKAFRKEISDRYEGKLRNLKREYEKKEQERFIKEERQTLLHGIETISRRIVKRLVNPTDQRNIPMAYRVEIAKILKGLNFGTAVRLGNTLSESERLYAKAKKAIEQIVSTKAQKLTEKEQAQFDEMNIDPDMKANIEIANERLEELMRENGNKPVALEQVDLETLYTVRDVMLAAQSAVTNYGKLLSEKRKGTVSGLAQQIYRDNQQPVKLRGAIRQTMKNVFTTDMMTVDTYFHAFGEGGDRIWEMLKSGEKKMVERVREAFYFMQNEAYRDIKDVEAFKKRINSKSTVEISFAEGNVSFTKGQFMELYALSRREQAVQHMEKGGIVTGTMKKGVKVTRAEVWRVVEKHLTEEERSFVDRIQRFTSTTEGEWGNEVTRTEFGYEKFTDPHYWRINVDKRTVPTNDKSVSDKAGMWGVRNFGATKKLNEKAINPIRIGNLLDTFSEHTENMARYNGYGLVVRDMMNWYNYQSAEGEGANTKKVIENVYGVGSVSKKNAAPGKSPGSAYFEKFMQDLSGQNGDAEVTATRILNKMASGYKAAAMGLNFRVAMQQPTAVVRAMDMISPKYFAKSLMHKGAFKEAARWSTTAQLKSWGFMENALSTEFAKVITGDKSGLDTVKDNAMIFAAKADEVTWGHIWEACKRKIDAEQKKADKDKRLKKGSDAYFEAVAELFDNVTYQTQVFDSVLTRSQNMRSDNALIRLSTAFTSEPSKSYNMLLRELMDFRKSGKKMPPKRFFKKLSAIVASQALAAMAAAAASAFRDDDDYKTWLEKWQATVGKEFVGNINPFSAVPIASELSDWLLSKIGAVEDYGSTDMYWTALESTGAIIDGVAKMIADGDYSSETMGKLLNKTARTLSQLTGVPVYNVMRELSAIWNAGADLMHNRDIKWRLSSYNSTADSVLYTQLFDAMGRGDTTVITRVQNELAARGTAQDKIDSGLKKIFYERYELDLLTAAGERRAGDIALYEEKVEELMEETGLDRRIVLSAIDSALKRIEDEEEATKPTEKPEEKEPEEVSAYSTADVNRYLEAGNTDAAHSAIEDIVAVKVANGKDDKTARSNVKTQVTAYWKPLYIEAYEAGNESEMLKIRELLFATGLYGGKNETVKTVSGWVSTWYKKNQK